MSRTSNTFQWEYLIAAGFFLVLCIYAYGFLIDKVYMGFKMDANLKIAEVFVDVDSQPTLQEGDTLIKVGTIDLRLPIPASLTPLFHELQTGDTVNLTVLRNSEELSIPWGVPGSSPSEVLDRFVLITAALAFWVVGTGAMILLRPKDTRWWTMIMASYSVAMMLITGLATTTSFLLSPTLYQFVLWLQLPIYLQLHWVFPKPLSPLPRGLVWAVYISSAILAMLDILGIIPSAFAIFWMFIAILGSIILLIMHAILQPDQRQDVYILAATFLVITIPTMISGVTILLDQAPPTLSITTIVLPVIPIAYFLIIYRRQVGGMEWRANRAVIMFVYTLILLTIILPVMLLSQNWISRLNLNYVVTIWFVIIVALVSAAAYPRYQRWAEKIILGIKITPEQVLDDYTARISTSLDLDRLVNLLKAEILPSLLIRQAVMLRLNGMGIDGTTRRLNPLFSMGVTTSQIPRPAEIQLLLEQSGRIRKPPENIEALNLPSPWVRLSLPLVVDGKTIGVFLAGRRDPDDTYNNNEISALQAIMNQTALALVNIEQARRLHALYQKDIESREDERTKIARELHDDVLTEMALLAQAIDLFQANPQLAKAYQTSVQRIREIISDLRPAMLNFGLRPALDELIEELQNHIILSNIHDLSIDLRVPASQERYPEEVEVHLYRIIQQACHNAIKHANASRVEIYGFLGMGQVEIHITDDGIGFELGENVDLAGLLASKHFGLAGMYERAALIGAKIDILSSPGAGTRVQINWNIRDYATRLV